MRETYQCLCGLSVQWTWKGKDRPEQVDRVKGIILAQHVGDDHGQTDARTAYQVRRKAERKGRDDG